MARAPSERFPAPPRHLRPRHLLRRDFHDLLRAALLDGRGEGAPGGASGKQASGNIWASGANEALFGGAEHIEVVLLEWQLGVCMRGYREALKARLTIIWVFPENMICISMFETN